MLVLLFAGCTKPVEPSEASPFAVYRIKDGIRFSIGDKRSDIEKIITEPPEFTVEFEDETPEDQMFEILYYGYISLGYDRAGNVLRLRIYDNEWKIANGLKVTDSVESVKGKYPQEHMHSYNESNDIYISYDENGNTTEYSSKSPYILRFVIESYAIKEIVIEKNML